ncbi:MULTISPECIES: D-ribose pyranase [Thermotoga]|uniref:D-ribose pyranase n=3 Tax=Thermotoga petrophila TaxID=93929 RepID=RBSD_THEP1|nr:MULTISPECIES: D-ribose pyranase [Thermotoga]A5INL8.1 RecName: Full=D-ribose pyranase [Thermotoga petrophila RKU-1]KUK22684.1 MAG: D-ribose pyranase [Thermotoga petrophila]ABQ47791.1 RbsD or FucU transport [Thermotoga petrophila RKU-1]ADA67852.1 RbsD or FucU transport [Thermotoga petrophila RKU-10]AIY89041.1 D-ribose pyranase [Thermotoga sp. Cell2]KHC93211.1 D-ribose pyranase [Thermotoga sp. TBGT1765]
MKRVGILNSTISEMVANMGHTDMLAIVDMGFPIPDGAKKVDLVVDKGKPGLLEVVEVILKELEVEKIILAEEMNEKNPETRDLLINLVGKNNSNVKIEFVPHEEFKKISRTSKGFVRTGADRPYSNVILVSGVIF